MQLLSNNSFGVQNACLATETVVSATESIVSVTKATFSAHKASIVMVGPSAHLIQKRHRKNNHVIDAAKNKAASITCQGRPSQETDMLRESLGSEAPQLKTDIPGGGRVSEPQDNFERLIDSVRKHFVRYVLGPSIGHQKPNWSFCQP